MRRWRRLLGWWSYDVSPRTPRTIRRWGRERFRMGYYAALQDIERTGLVPKTVDAMKESADRHLRQMDWR